MDEPTTINNVVRRVSYRGGWIGFFTGNSKRRTLERGIQDLNAAGHRVILVEKDEWGWIGKLLSILLLIVTLGLFTFEEGYLVIGEPVDH